MGELKLKKAANDENLVNGIEGDVKNESSS